MRYLQLAVVLVATLIPRAVDAQTVLGRAYELWSNRALPDVLLVLVSQEGDSLSAVWSDENGAFQLTAPDSGLFYVSARKIGYGMVVDGPLALADSQTVVVGLHLQPSVLYRLDPVTITAEPAVRRLVLVGFYDRMQSTTGAFIDRVEIEKRASARHAADLLRGIPGVQVDFSGNVRVTGIASGLGPCGSPRLYVDGFVREGSADLQAINAWDIEGIEIYRRPTEVPAQYGGPTSACGVIVIWTGSGR